MILDQFEDTFSIFIENLFLCPKKQKLKKLKMPTFFRLFYVHMEFDWPMETVDVSHPQINSHVHCISRYSRSATGFRKKLLVLRSDSTCLTLWRKRIRRGKKTALIQLARNKSDIPEFEAQRESLYLCILYIEIVQLLYL